MDTLDLPAVLTKVHDLQRLIHSHSIGLDALRTLTLTGDEQSLVSKLQESYRNWQRGLQALDVAVQEVLNLGYPVLPTLSAPQSMLDHIQEILAQIHEAQTLLLAQAAAAMKATFGDPEPQ